MKFKSSLLVSIMMLVLIIALGGCKASRQLSKSNKSYEIGEYYKSIEQYRKTYRKAKGREVKAEIQFHIAEAYKYIGEYKRAASFYKTAITRGYSDPIAILHYADVLRADGEYDEAISNYQLYLKSQPGDKHALNGIASCDRTPKWLENPTRFQIEDLKTLNSKASDYAGVYPGGHENQIVFTSSRDGATGRRDSPITGQLYGDIFHSYYDKQKGRWEKPTLIDENLVVDTGDDEGAASFDSRGTTMYFTRCRYDKTKSMGAEVYTSSETGGSWSEPVRVELGGDSLMIAHPSLSADGRTIYFVSDMPGGFGGKDIWKAEGAPGAWGKPENLGPAINTPGNEMFPFIRDNGELYFSSDYRIGMGGLDIFKAVKDDKGQWQVENLKSPINSPGDDFGIYFIPGEDRGLFTTNRKGTRGDDIFSFVLPPKIFEIDGEVVDKETGNRLRNATIRLIGTDGTMLRLNAENGKFKFRLNPETDYVVAGFKKGFLNAKANETTIGLNDSKTFDVSLALTPTDAPIRVDNIYFDFGKWDLLPESKNALDSLVQILVQNPTVTIELMAHTDCRGEAQFNFELSQKRAESVVNYLVANGISPARLVAKGYGETAPKTVTRKLAEKYNFLKRGDELTCDFINKLPTEEEQEICHQINRRTEFKVLSTDYREKFAPSPKE